MKQFMLKVENMEDPRSCPRILDSIFKHMDDAMDVAQMLARLGMVVTIIPC